MGIFGTRRWLEVGVRRFGVEERRALSRRKESHRHLGPLWKLWKMVTSRRRCGRGGVDEAGGEGR